MLDSQMESHDWTIVRHGETRISHLYSPLVETIELPGPLVSNGRSSEDLSLIHFLAASWWERFALQFRFEWKSTQRPSPFPYEPLGKEKGRWSFQRPKPIVAPQSKKHRRQKNRPQSSQLRAILSSASFQLTALKKTHPMPIESRSPSLDSGTDSRIDLFASIL